MWFSILKRKYDTVEAKKKKVTDEGHVEGMTNQKSRFSDTLPAGQYTIMDGKSFVGEKFNGKEIDKRTSTKYTKLQYPNKKDEKGRVIEQKVTPKEAKDSRKYGRTGSSPFEREAQAGQKKKGKYELDLSKPEPKPSAKGKFTSKEGKRITPIRLKKISFKEVDFSKGMFAFYRKTDPSGVIKLCNFVGSKWDGATLAAVTFEDCDFRKVDLTKANIKRDVMMIRCNVRGASIPKEIKLIEPKNKDKMYQGKRK